MAESAYDDENVQTFEYDEVKAQIEASVENVLGQNVYNPKKVHAWTQSIVEAVLKSLQQSSKPFKYVGSCSVRWENKTMHAIVTVFALHI